MTTKHNVVSVKKKLKKYAKNSCSIKTVKKRLPILDWLPRYNTTFLIQDVIAGVTVGLTAIPQGIAYAVVAGLSPEFGLYAGLMGGFVYLFFGSSKDITVGPTAIMSTMVSKYAGFSPDLAILAAFLSGIVELIMGILHLGFLVEFISQPVINGFTNSAALQIAASQLKSLFGLSGDSGHYFYESVINFIKNIKTAQLWDPIFGFSTIVILILLKKLGQGCSRTDGTSKQMRWFLSLARNAIVVIVGAFIAYILKITTNSEPLTLIGEIGEGLPTLKPPPFSTVVGNETYSFANMVQILGPQSIVLPLVAILESVAVAKAFAGGRPVDATQEMMALGLCNIIGSFASSMPITGSFTRTALNYASGVQTPAGGVFTGLLIILALSLLTSAFYFIPKTTLAGLIITAMFSMMEIKIFCRLWKNSKREFLVIVITMSVCLFVGLEYGIITGIVTEALMLLYFAARPKVSIDSMGSDGNLIVVQLLDNISYCAAEHIRRAVLQASQNEKGETILAEGKLVIDGTNLRSMDTTVVTNLMSIIKDLEKKDLRIYFLNFNGNIRNMCSAVNPDCNNKFVTATSAKDLVSEGPKHF